MILVTAPTVACSQPTPASQSQAAQSAPARWTAEFPLTDFGKSTIPFSEITEGGPPKDGIRSIDEPRFGPAAGPYPLRLGTKEPVISFSYGGEARAYPLRILIRHEIVNDVIAGRPIAVTYCPLCDSAVVFDRRFDGQVLDFGTTGKLRHSDMVMYDRQSETWWQQFVGGGLVGKYAGRELTVLPARVESLEIFRQRFPRGQILLPADAGARLYQNPYENYDSRDRPLPFFTGDLPQDIEPMARVVAVGDKAWSLRALSRRGRIEDGNLVLTWQAGQNSAVDQRDISKGRDIGNVVVQRKSEGKLVDVPYDVTFAFAFFALRPKGRIIDE
ncbi:DUF3179 domain-containing protein [Sphingomonas sp.]|uniref:DUF3179 domain-containing protein n=1 Tax=Sphingomonas sp. TaxID=28214 RepID=UPI0017B9BC62|nr:DUF3179 domain-containing protein [Sphingomonas sp.]MBA3511116.1 DUF3179 domain-containing protein [Sphingomonas sp.]